MKVSGFTIVRNAINFDYPVVEAISSILPICNEVIVCVGKSDDDTLKLIQNINSDKIKIIETVWDDSLRKGGKVLAQQTDKALKHVSPDADWCFYIQADEILHEQFQQNIVDSMCLHKDELRVDGLLFDYQHFYGSYNYVADAYNWYKNEIRVIRNDKSIYSYKDAQGFRKGENKKLCVKRANATIYHYGWVKHPATQQNKQKTFHKFWHTDEWVSTNIKTAQEFDYNSIDSLQPFNGTHPQVMKQRIELQNWKFEFDTSKSKMKLKYRVRKWLKEKFGLSLGEYRNYRLLK